jgi:hypothetical protein
MADNFWFVGQSSADAFHETVIYITNPYDFSRVLNLSSLHCPKSCVRDFPAKNKVVSQQCGLP